jgi:hypothetical protein
VVRVEITARHHRVLMASHTLEKAARHRRRLSSPARAVDEFHSAALAGAFAEEFVLSKVRITAVIRYELPIADLQLGRRWRTGCWEFPAGGCRSAREAPPGPGSSEESGVDLDPKRVTQEGESRKGPS